MKPLPRHRRSGDAAGGGPARVKALGPGAVLHRLQVAGGGAERDPLRHHQLGFAQLHQPPGQHAGGERADDARRMKTRFHEAAARGTAQPRPRFETQCQGGEHCCPADLQLIGQCQRGRHGARREMHRPGQIGVVEVEPMHEDAVHHRGVARRQPRRQADHGCLSAAQRLQARQCLVRELIGRRSKRIADRIEHQQLRARANVCGNRIQRCCSDKGGERLRERAWRCGHVISLCLCCADAPKIIA